MTESMKCTILDRFLFTLIINREFILADSLLPNTKMPKYIPQHLISSDLTDDI